MKVCFFASVSDRKQLPKTFYGRDIQLLEEIGYQVTIATRMREISPRCDVVFGWWFGSGVRALLAAQILRRPCVLSGCVESLATTANRRRYQQFLINYCLKHADGLAVLSRHDLDNLAPSSRPNVHVIRPGMSPPAHRATFREREPMILAIGTVGMGSGSRRRLDSLVRALALVHRRIPELTLHLAGSRGPGYRDLCDLIDELQIAPSVRLDGRVSFEKRDELYRRTLILVHPVIYENLAIAPLEAMSEGLPVLTSRCDLTWEVAGDSAQYCDSADPEEIAGRIIALAADPALWERCSAGGYERVRGHYSREQRRAELQQLVERTLSDYRAGGL
jgi:glycosyltransferase involved in cell wall biosynthesis